MISNDIDKLKREWNLADKWFRLIEFSLILATLNYFAIKTNSTVLKVTYYFSFSMIIGIITSLVDSILINLTQYEKYGKLKKLFSWFLVLLIITAIYAVISNSTQEIIESGKVN